MTNKTCGNCKHLNRELAFCRACGARWIKDTDGANCQYFEKITPPTNGDVIRQMSNAELALLDKCDWCMYFDGVFCTKPDDKTCADGIEPYLNAPAESEVYNETTSN